MKDPVLPLVRDFLSQNPIKHIVGGEQFASAEGRTTVVLDPATASPLATVSLGGTREIDAAVDAAQRALPSWAGLTPAARCSLLHRWANLMESHSAALSQIETLDVGKAVTASETFDIPFGIEGLRYFADLATQATYDVPLTIKNIEARVHRAPYGVCGFIFPWNFPFDLLMWGVAPALAAGNTVVVKPSEVTPLSTLYAAQLAAEAGLPPGVLNVVVGDGPEAGAALTGHPLVRRISFTGSPEAGAIVGSACGNRIVPCKLELGGKGAAVVLEDADIAETAKKLAAAITLNTGQVCCTATRWIVHESVTDSLLDAAVAEMRGVRVGHGLNRSTDMGPLVSEAQRKRVMKYYEAGRADGARVALEGCVPDEPGYFVSPWLLEGSHENVCFREEIFGPAAFVTRFRSEAEALDLVHQIDYGLANSVWTTDLERASRFAEKMVVGNTWINAHNVFAYGLPYGGVNRSGMGGGVNSPATFYDYLRDQTIARPL
jgi:aldehyde dehydrogenase (NAD+)